MFFLLLPKQNPHPHLHRQAIVPAFHQAWLGAMTRMFGRVALASASNISRAIDESASASGKGEAVVDMEAAFLSFGLDVIGLGVFNFDFGSVTAESPVIKSVYGVLKEAEHRSTFYIPYWNLPLSSVLVPRQRRFRADLAVINACLDDLIEGEREERREEERGREGGREKKFFIKKKTHPFLSFLSLLHLHLLLQIQKAPAPPATSRSPRPSPPGTTAPRSRTLLCSASWSTPAALISETDSSGTI